MSAWVGLAWIYLRTLLLLEHLAVLTNATIKQTTQWKVLENLTTYVVYVGFEECFSNVLMLFFKSVGTTSTKDEVAGGIFAFNLTNGYFAKTHELLKSLQITEVLLSKHLLKI